MISARKGEGVDDLRIELAKMMPESQHLYDRDALTDMPMSMENPDSVSKAA
jgi:GTPase Era involved in 16S rRNA processing